MVEYICHGGISRRILARVSIIRTTVCGGFILFAEYTATGPVAVRLRSQVVLSAKCCRIARLFDETEEFWSPPERRKFIKHTRVTRIIDWSIIVHHAQLSIILTSKITPYNTRGTTKIPEELTRGFRFRFKVNDN